MGIRDRGYVLDFYIPLFAGVDAGGRAGSRTRFPFSQYAPYVTDGGDGAPGGIRGGDGGINTPIDHAISKPDITNPDIAPNNIMSVNEAFTSSAFSSSNGQTHAMSRWIIEYLGPPGPTPPTGLPPEGTGIVMYDSGPLSTALTTLPSNQSVIGMSPEAWYRITVRYKGSGGGWSDWAVWAPFQFEGCDTGGAPVTCTQYMVGAVSTTNPNVGLYGQPWSMSLAAAVLAFTSARGAGSGYAWVSQPGCGSVSQTSPPSSAYLVRSCGSPEASSFGQIGYNTRTGPYCFSGSTCPAPADMPPPAPAAPAPAPAPVPAPPPPQGVPAGFSQLLIDWKNSYVLSDIPTCDAVVTFTQIDVAGGKIVGYSANIGLYVQNQSSTKNGSLNIGVSVNSTNVTVTPAQQSVPVSAGNFVVANFIVTAIVLGSYDVTINTGTTTKTFKLGFGGDCNFAS